MTLTVRYDDEWQVLELNAEDIEKLWISLSIEDEGLSQKEKEDRLQEEFDRQFNRPEYNNMHRFDRHRGFSMAMSDEDEEEFDNPEPLFSEVIDDRMFRKYEIQEQNRKQHEEVCERVRNILSRKPHWAEAVIAVRIDGMSVNDYAASIGLRDASAVSHWLSRAEKKLREKYPETSEKLRLHGYPSENNSKGGHEDV